MLHNKTISISISKYHRLLQHKFHHWLQYLSRLVQFEVLIAVTMMMSVFWDITACCLVKVKWCFWGTERVSQAWNKQVPCLAYSLTLKIEEMCSLKRHITFTGLRSVMSEDRTLQIQWSLPFSQVWFNIVLLSPYWWTFSVARALLSLLSYCLSYINRCL
jgi:hypothetical protein